MGRINKWRGFLFVLPSLVGVAIFYIIPFGSSLIYCFTAGIANRRFVGLENFKILFQNKAYKLTLYNTGLIIGTALPILCLVAVGLALVIEKELKKYRFLQGWLLLPLTIPTASMVLIWKDLFAEQGIINAMIHARINWLDSKYGFLMVIGMIIWKNIGYDTLLIISSLLTLPKEYEEAASLEGAGDIRIALTIKVPQLVPMLLFTVIISLLNCFKIFREVYLLQGNYPSKNLYLLQHFMNNNFTKLNYEMLATAAFVLYIVIFMVIYCSVKWQQSYINNNL
jgi:multiple sugar transport system permease protein